MQKFREELEKHCLRRITTGKSGADVYELTGNRIAKHVRRAEVADDAKWESYANEANFYRQTAEERLTFLPEILMCIIEEDEIGIIMRKYRPMEPETHDGAMLERMMAVLAQIHRMPFTAAETEPKRFDDAQLSACAEGWQSVLAEHGDGFDAAVPERIAAEINEINRLAYTPRQCRVHGDFHAENLLLDDGGNIVVCDWQSTGAGHPAADIAFFLSRLGADDAAREAAISAYCRYAAGISPEEIDEQMRLANLNTTFEFWHYFLHGSDESAVRRVFVPMEEDAARLKDR